MSLLRDIAVDSEKFSRIFYHDADTDFAMPLTIDHKLPIGHVKDPDNVYVTAKHDISVRFREALDVQSNGGVNDATIDNPNEGVIKYDKDEKFNDIGGENDAIQLVECYTTPYFGLSITDSGEKEIMRVTGLSEEHYRDFTTLIFDNGGSYQEVWDILMGFVAPHNSNDANDMFTNEDGLPIYVLRNEEIQPENLSNGDIKAFITKRDDRTKYAMPIALVHDITSFVNANRFNIRVFTSEIKRTNAILGFSTIMGPKPVYGGGIISFGNIDVGTDVKPSFIDKEFTSFFFSSWLMQSTESGKMLRVKNYRKEVIRKVFLPKDFDQNDLLTPNPIHFRDIGVSIYFDEKDVPYGYKGNFRKVQRGSFSTSKEKITEILSVFEIGSVREKYKIYVVDRKEELEVEIDDRVVIEKPFVFFDEPIANLDDSVYYDKDTCLMRNGYRFSVSSKLFKCGFTALRVQDETSPPFEQQPVADLQRIGVEFWSTFLPLPVCITSSDVPQSVIHYCTFEQIKKYHALLDDNMTIHVVGYVYSPLKGVVLFMVRCRFNVGVGNLWDGFVKYIQFNDKRNLDAIRGKHGFDVAFPQTRESRYSAITYNTQRDNVFTTFLRLSTTTAVNNTKSLKIVSEEYPLTHNIINVSDLNDLYSATKSHLGSLRRYNDDNITTISFVANSNEKYIIMNGEVELYQSMCSINSEYGNINLFSPLDESERGVSNVWFEYQLHNFFLPKEHGGEYFFYAIEENALTETCFDVTGALIGKIVDIKKYILLYSQIKHDGEIEKMNQTSMTQPELYTRKLSISGDIVIPEDSRTKHLRNVYQPPNTKDWIGIDKGFISSSKHYYLKPTPIGQKKVEEIVDSSKLPVEFAKFKSDKFEGELFLRKDKLYFNKNLKRYEFVTENNPQIGKLEPIPDGTLIENHIPFYREDEDEENHRIFADSYITWKDGDQERCKGYLGIADESGSEYGYYIKEPKMTFSGITDYEDIKEFVKINVKKTNDDNSIKEGKENTLWLKEKDGSFDWIIDSVISAPASRDINVNVLRKVAIITDDYDLDENDAKKPIVVKIIHDNLFTGDAKEIISFGDEKYAVFKGPYKPSWNLEGSDTIIAFDKYEFNSHVRDDLNQRRNSLNLSLSFEDIASNKNSTIPVIRDRASEIHDIFAELWVTSNALIDSNIPTDIHAYMIRKAQKSLNDKHIDVHPIIYDNNGEGSILFLYRLTWTGKLNKNNDSNLYLCQLANSIIDKYQENPFLGVPHDQDPSLVGWIKRKPTDKTLVRIESIKKPNESKVFDDRNSNYGLVIVSMNQNGAFEKRMYEKGTLKEPKQRNVFPISRGKFLLIDSVSKKLKDIYDKAKGGNLLYTHYKLLVTSIDTIPLLLDINNFSQYVVGKYDINDRGTPYINDNGDSWRLKVKKESNKSDKPGTENNLALVEFNGNEGLEKVPIEEKRRVLKLMMLEDLSKKNDNDINFEYEKVINYLRIMHSREATYGQKIALRRKNMDYPATSTIKAHIGHDPIEKERVYILPESKRKWLLEDVNSLSLADDYRETEESMADVVGIELILSKDGNKDTYRRYSGIKAKDSPYKEKLVTYEFGSNERGTIRVEESATTARGTVSVFGGNVYWNRLHDLAKPGSAEDLYAKWNPIPYGMEKRLVLVRDNAEKGDNEVGNVGELKLAMRINKSKNRGGDLFNIDIETLVRYMNLQFSGKEFNISYIQLSPFRSRLASFAERLLSIKPWKIADKFLRFAPLGTTLSKEPIELYIVSLQLFSNNEVVVGHTMRLEDPNTGDFLMKKHDVVYKSRHNDISGKVVTEWLPKSLVEHMDQDEYPFGPLKMGVIGVESNDETATLTNGNYFSGLSCLSVPKQDKDAQKRKNIVTLLMHHVYLLERPDGHELHVSKQYLIFFDMKTFALLGDMSLETGVADVLKKYITETKLGTVRDEFNHLIVHIKFPHAIMFEIKVNGTFNTEEFNYNPLVDANNITDLVVSKSEILFKKGNFAASQNIGNILREMKKFDSLLEDKIKLVYGNSDERFNKENLNGMYLETIEDSTGTSNSMRYSLKERSMGDTNSAELSKFDMEIFEKLGWLHIGINVSYHHGYIITSDTIQLSYPGHAENKRELSMNHLQVYYVSPDDNIYLFDGLHDDTPRDIGALYNADNAVHGNLSAQLVHSLLKENLNKYFAQLHPKSKYRKVRHLHQQTQKKAIAVALNETAMELIETSMRYKKVDQADRLYLGIYVGTKIPELEGMHTTCTAMGIMNGVFIHAVVTAKNPQFIFNHCLLPFPAKSTQLSRFTFSHYYDDPANMIAIDDVGEYIKKRVSRLDNISGENSLLVLESVEGVQPLDKVDESGDEVMYGSDSAKDIPYGSETMDHRMNVVIYSFGGEISYKSGDSDSNSSLESRKLDTVVYTAIKVTKKTKTLIFSDGGKIVIDRYPSVEHINSIEDPVIKQFSLDMFGFGVNTEDMDEASSVMPMISITRDEFFGEIAHGSNYKVEFGDKFSEEDKKDRTEVGNGVYLNRNMTDNDLNLSLYNNMVAVIKHQQGKWEYRTVSLKKDDFYTRIAHAAFIINTDARSRCEDRRRGFYAVCKKSTSKTEALKHVIERSPVSFEFHRSSDNMPRMADMYSEVWSSPQNTTYYVRVRSIGDIVYSNASQMASSQSKLVNYDGSDSLVFREIKEDVTVNETTKKLEWVKAGMKELLVKNGSYLKLGAFPLDGQYKVVWEDKDDSLTHILTYPIYNKKIVDGECGWILPIWIDEKPRKIYLTFARDESSIVSMLLDNDAYPKSDTLRSLFSVIDKKDEDTLRKRYKEIFSRDGKLDTYKQKMKENIFPSNSSSSSVMIIDDGRSIDETYVIDAIIDIEEDRVHMVYYVKEARRVVVKDELELSGLLAKLKRYLQIELMDLLYKEYEQRSGTGIETLENVELFKKNYGERLKKAPFLDRTDSSDLQFYEISSQTNEHSFNYPRGLLFSPVVSSKNKSADTFQSATGASFARKTNSNNSERLYMKITIYKRRL